MNFKDKIISSGKAHFALLLALLILTSCDFESSKRYRNKTDGNSTFISEQGKINTADGKIWYRIIGDSDKTPILALHGGPGGKSRYFYPISKISKDRPFILFDQLGSGLSDHHQDTSLLKVEKFVDQVKLVKEVLGLDEYFLLGQSWGSALALEYYQKYPEGIKGLIFSGPFFSTKLWEKDADTLISYLSDSVQNIIAKAEENKRFDTKEYQFADSIYWSKYGRRHPWPEHPLDTLEVSGNAFIYNYMWGPSEFTALGTLKNYDNTESLKSIKVPALFIAGEYDEARKETVKYFNSLVPNSQMAIIPDAGHSSMTDNPEAYKKALSRFIDELEK